MHEGVINRADRDQPFAPKAVRQTGRPKQREQVHFGNTKFDMLPLGPEIPFRSRRNSVFGKGIRQFLTRKQPLVVDESAKPGGPGHAGRCAQGVFARFRESGPLKRALFDAHHIPAKGVADFLDPLERPLADDPVQRLAMIQQQRRLFFHPSCNTS